MRMLYVITLFATVSAILAPSVSPAFEESSARSGRVKRQFGMGGWGWGSPWDGMGMCCDPCCGGWFGGWGGGWWGGGWGTPFGGFFG